MVGACGGGATDDAVGTGIAVPDVVGESVEYGRGVIDASGLITQVVEVGGAGKPGEIFEQVPAAGTIVETGSKVIVQVSESALASHVEAPATPRACPTRWLI